MRAKRQAPAANVPVTLSEAKAHCRVTTSDEDAVITGLIGAATVEMENRLQRTLCETTWTLTLDEFPDAIKLPMPPILSVASITYRDASGAVVTLDPADYIVDTASEPGWVLPAPGLTWPETQNRANAVTVTYSAGYRAGGTTQQQQDAVPRDIRAFLLIRVATLFENRESVSFASAPFQITALDSLWQPYRVIEA